LYLFHDFLEGESFVRSEKKKRGKRESSPGGEERKKKRGKKGQPELKNEKKKETGHYYPVRTAGTGKGRGKRTAAANGGKKRSADLRLLSSALYRKRSSQSPLSRKRGEGKGGKKGKRKGKKKKKARRAVFRDGERKEKREHTISLYFSLFSPFPFFLCRPPDGRGGGPISYFTRELRRREGGKGKTKLSIITISPLSFSLQLRQYRKGRERILPWQELKKRK